MLRDPRDTPRSRLEATALRHPAVAHLRIARLPLLVHKSTISPTGTKYYTFHMTQPSIGSGTRVLLVADVASRLLIRCLGCRTPFVYGRAHVRHSVHATDTVSLVGMALSQRYRLSRQRRRCAPIRRLSVQHLITRPESCNWSRCPPPTGTSRRLPGTCRSTEASVPRFGTKWRCS